MKLPDKIYLELSRGRYLEVEEYLMEKYAEHFGVPCERFSLKHMERNRIKLGPNDFVVGSIQAIRAAMRQYGKKLVEHTPYPNALKHLLHREVRYFNSLGEAKQLLDKGESYFIKPANWKSFTGFVTSVSDDHRFFGTSNRIPAYVSTVVQFQSEWRCYVADGEWLAISFAGDEKADRYPMPDKDVIREAITELTASGEAPAGYAIDFGVLNTGETALVELNDGFSIGAYDDVNFTHYGQVIYSRWRELIATKE